MTFINKILSDKNFKIKFFLVFSFSVSWLSISSGYQNLLIIYSNEPITITQVLNFFRAALNLFVFPLLCFILVRTLIKIDKFKSIENLLILAPFIYFLSQIPGLFYTSNSIENLIFVISAINLLIIMNISIRLFKINEINILIYIIFILLSCVLMATFSTDLINFFTLNENSEGKKFYGSLNRFLGDNYIRSSGSSRVALVLLVIYVTILIKHINSKILRIIPLFLFSSIIFLYESRAGIILLTLFLILDLFYGKNPTGKKFYFEKFKNYSIYCLLIPLLVSIQINYMYSPAWRAVQKNIVIDESKTFLPKNFKQLLKNNGLNSISDIENSTLEKLMKILNIDRKTAKIFREQANKITLNNPNTQIENITILNYNSNILNKLYCDITKCNDDSIRIINKTKLLTTSGRLNDWKNILDKFEYGKNMMFGYGSQGDRYLINQTASNALIYAFASSGIVGLSCFIIFSIVACIEILKFLFIKKPRNSISQLSTFILIIILTRSLIESSYAVFGIDFMLFNICLILVRRYNSTQ